MGGAHLFLGNGGGRIRRCVFRWGGTQVVYDLGWGLCLYAILGEWALSGVGVIEVTRLIETSSYNSRNHKFRSRFSPMELSIGTTFFLFIFPYNSLIIPI